MNLDKDRLEEDLKTSLTKELENQIGRRNVTISEFVTKESIVRDLVNACMKAVREYEKLEDFGKMVDLLTDFYGLDKALGTVKELEMLKEGIEDE